jgi:aspartate/methionine/tyrosine aminotransferase
MFSRRTAWDTSPNALSQALSARAGYIDLTVTNPGKVGLGPTDGMLRDLLASAPIARYEPEPLGLPAAREAIARHHGIDPADVLVTASTSESYAQLFKLLCDPGDELLVPAPSYPLLEFLAGLESARLVPYPTFYADGWHVDLDALRHRVTPRTRAVVVVAPNNPTGALLRPHERDEIASICAENELAIISDEVFADFVTGVDPHRVRTLAGHDRCLTFVLGGLSKVCLAPGMKAGWTLVSGPPEQASQAMQRLEVIADTSLSVSTFSQHLVAPLLAAKDALQAPLHARLRSNRIALVQALQGSAASVLESDGGWMAVVRVPADRSDEERCLQLLDAGVLVHPGHFYDFAREGHLVVSLLAPEHDLIAGARVIARHAQG